MDFHSLLNKAAKNATSVNKTLETVDSEIAERKRQELKKIEADKRAKQDLALKKRALIPKRESTPEKKFVIPKKKTESSVDINGVKNFLAKQEESKKIAEKQKKIEKDNLIQLRIQSHGGKANKKIGKQFGMDPIHLQIRYGNDHTHVERLQKQQWREEEELDNLSTQYKGGVYKAIQERNKKLAEIKPGDKKEPHRVATSKSNSLYGLSSRHGNTRDHFSPPKDTKKEATKPPPVSAERKRPAAPPVDFNALMKVAADKTAGKNVDLSTLAPPPPKISKQNMDRPSSSKDVRPNYSSSSNSFKKPSALPSSSTKDQRDPQRTSNSSMSSKPKPTPSNSSSTKRPEAKPVSKTDSSSNTAKQSDKDNKGSKDAKGRFVKAPTPPPAIPSAVLGRRYLPGDVRIKQQQEMMKAAGITPSPSSSHKKGPDMESLFGSSRKPESSKVRAPDNRVSSSSNNYSSSSSAQRYSQPSSKSSSKPNVSRDKEKVREIERRKRAMEKQRYEKIRWEGMSLVERERERERQKFREMYQDEEEDEDDDEYDSGDDFIDDSGMDMDDFNRMDFEETLKMVNPKYDEKKWKIREKMISERDMETNYRNISREEARSARLGFMEDVLEAKKGKSIRL